MSVKSRPSRWNGTRMLSRVVPATSLVIRRSSPMRRLISVDLPTFGPADDGDADAAIVVLLVRAARRGKPASTMSMSSSQPEPCVAEIAYGSPRPMLWKSAPAMPLISPSALLTARNTGLPERRSSLAKN